MKQFNTYCSEPSMVCPASGFQCFNLVHVLNYFSRN